MSEAVLNKEGEIPEGIDPTADQKTDKMSLRGEMIHFTTRYLRENSEGRYLAPDVRDRIQNILEGADDFENAVKELDQAGIMLSRDNRSKLENVRESVGEDFSDVLIEHYSKLEEEISDMIRKVQERGADYIMDGTKGYNEEVAQDLEMILRRMTLGYRLVNTRILEEQSDDYTNVGVDLERKKSEIDRISKVFHMLESNASVKEIRNSIMSLVKNSLHHMHDGIAAQTDIAISRYPDEEYHRGLDTLRGGALEQLEFLLNLIAKSVYAARDINVQKTFLLGKDMELDDDEKLLSA